MEKALYLPQKNKIFLMNLTGNTIFIKFGEIGKTQLTKTKPAADWNKIIDEKKRVGYVDMEVSAEKKEEAKEDLSKAQEVLMYLQNISRQMVSQSYLLPESFGVAEGIDKAKQKLAELSHINSLYEFNQELFELFAIIPRRMSNPILYTAKSREDFLEILQREYDLLDNLSCFKTDKQSQAYNSSLRECTEKEKDLIMNLFEKHMRDKITQIYAFSNHETEAKYQCYLEKENIEEEKLLFHGSRNENWWSLMETGAKVNPLNVVISGKMFGHGIYFADSADKSTGYTSLKNARHTNSNSKRGFIGVYQVAYGQPYHIYNWQEKYVNLNESTIKEKHVNCVHAHKGKSLIHDEIIVYNNDACCLKYLVEMNAA